MNDPYNKGLPWTRFRDFISPTADRAAILKTLLEEAALDFSILEIAGSRHFVIAPPKPEEGFLRRPPVMLVAHYDRAQGSPGANDNSAAVFMLFETAMKLKTAGEINWVVIFTDNEEIKAGEGIQSQGAYTLAAGLKTAKMDSSPIFCFDACGTGDTMIISSTIEYLVNKEGGGEKILKSMAELRTMAFDAANALNMAKVFMAPTPFSDDAGFFRAGIAAQTITMLPSTEYSLLVTELRKNPNFAETLINAELRHDRGLKSIPETWRILNSRMDSYLRLTPRNFRTVIRFAEALCRG